MKQRRAIVLGALAAVLLLVVGIALWGGGSSEPEAAPETGPRVPSAVTIGTPTFTESVMIGEIYAQVLESRGISVERAFDLGVREQYLDKVAAGEVDIAPDYIGLLAEDVNMAVNGKDAAPVATGDVEQTTAALADLLEPHNAVLATPAPAQNGIGFAVRKDFAKANDLQTLSDLSDIAKDMTFGGPASCTQTEFCLPGLEEVYGLEFDEFKEYDLGGSKTLNALSSAKVDIGVVLTTDPAVDERDLVILEDDEKLQVAQNVTAVVASSVAAPEVMAALDSVNELLTTDELRDMNGQVSVIGLPAQWVATDWAASKGLIPADLVPEQPEPDPVETPKPPKPEPTYDYNRNMGEPSAEAKAQNWDALAQCESGGDPTIVSSGGSYHGLYQFSAQTWQAVGGTGVASDASAEEQTYRAQILWDMSSPGQWPVCGKNL